MLPNLPTKYIYIILGIGLVILVANLLFLDIVFVQQKNELLNLKTNISLPSKQQTTTPTTLSIPDSSCPISCQTLITAATASAKPTPQFINPSSQTPVSQKGEYFIPLGSGSLSSSSDWITIESAQATFDSANYGSIKNSYFEVVLNTTSGQISARLFDTTTPALFFNSEVATTTSASQFLSAPITLSSGNKTYKVQLKSTLAPGNLAQARIRIVTQ